MENELIGVDGHIETWLSGVIGLETRIKRSRYTEEDDITKEVRRALMYLKNEKKNLWL